MVVSPSSTRRHYNANIRTGQEVDSTRGGNKFRFINNSVKSGNCAPVIKLCGTVSRIGMYALRDLVPGEELYFNYQYGEEFLKTFWEPGERPEEEGAGPQNNSRPDAAATQSKTAALRKKKGESSSSSTGAGVGKRSAARSSTRTRRGESANAASAAAKHPARSTPERQAQTEKAREARLAKSRARRVALAYKAAIQGEGKS